MKNIILLAMFFFSLCVSAQVKTTPVKSPQKRLLGIEVHFKLGKHDLDERYMGNKQSLLDFAHKVDSIGLDRIDSVVVVSQSSPEGPYLYNMKLSERRANTMLKCVESRHPELQGKLFVHPDGESWEQLRVLVAQDTHLTAEEIEEVLQVIDADIDINVKKNRMKKLPCYRYLLQTYYPRIRNSMFCILYFTERLVALPLEEASYIPRPEIKVAPLRVPTLVEEQKTILALKTNLLYDAVSALNLEVEVPIGDRWSVMVEDVFPWWNNGNKWAMQMWEMGVEGRYWFKRTDARDVLSGWFGGLYGMSAKYDFQWKRSVNYQGEYWSAGLTCGYAMPLGKRLNLELSASLGYLSTAYRHYKPSVDYGELLLDPYKQGRVGYFGPTKLKVSLVVPIRITSKKNGGAL